MQENSLLNNKNDKVVKNSSIISSDFDPNEQLLKKLSEVSSVSEMTNTSSGDIESEVRSYVRVFPTVFDTAQGSILTDNKGKKYIDFFCGAGSLNYGHNNAQANQALLEYIQKDGIQHSLDKSTKAKLEFLHAFENIILKPRNLEYKVQFTGPTGTNAVEAAIKLARKVKQRSHIIAFSHAYHGHTLGALALTANSYYHNTYNGARNNVTHLPFDGYMGDGVDTSAYLEKVLSDQSSGVPIPAAIILETIQGEGGINVASSAWLQNIESICKRFNILLIVDDIQVGNGRTGKFFSFEHSGIIPDIVCLSKSLGVGLPFAVNLIKPDIDIWEPGEHTGTFRGNNLAFIAGRAVLEYWQGDFEAEIAERSLIVEKRLKKIAAKYNQVSYRGLGMIWGLDLGQGVIAKQVIQEAFNSGLLIESSGADDEVVKIMAALTIDLQILEDGLNLLDKAINKVLS